jgi:hypothetical protein
MSSSRNFLQNLDKHRYRMGCGVSFGSSEEKAGKHWLTRYDPMTF